MAGKSYNKVKGVVHGITPITEVQSVSLDQTGIEILAKGDDDVYHDGQALKTREVTGSITTRDVALGKSDSTIVGGGVQGTLVFEVIDETSGGANQVFTISNAMLFPPTLTADHDGEGDALVYNFRAISIDGQTNPVAQADA